MLSPTMAATISASIFNDRNDKVASALAEVVK
jgi:hypothetical protein